MMTAALPNPLALEALRQKLAELSGRSMLAVLASLAPSAMVLPTGHAPLDEALGGGLPRGRLVELSGAWSSGKATLALAVAARLTAARRLCVYVDGRGELYPPSAAALGVELARLLVVTLAPPGAGRAAGAERAAAGGGRAAAGGVARAGEIAARTGAFPLVILDLADDERVDEAAAGRLRAAAASGGAVVLALAPGRADWRRPRSSWRRRPECSPCARAAPGDARRGRASPGRRWP